MGTRNLTIVKSKKQTKVAQYGQWDGYPTGQGQNIADFLKKVDLVKFKKQINQLGVYSEEDIRNAYKEAGHYGKSELVTSDIATKVNKTHPALNRDYGAGILQLIHDGVVMKVDLQEDFKDDGLYCEYYYTIDLDKETVSMNGGKEYSFKSWTRKGLMEKLENNE